MSDEVPLEVPRELQAHAVWCAPDPSRATPEVVFVTERRWRRIALVLGAIGILCSLGGVGSVILAHGNFTPYLVATVVCSGAGMAFHRAGRAGFYQVRADGHLGSYLGRRAPDLRGLRRRKFTSAT